VPQKAPNQQLQQAHNYIKFIKARPACATWFKGLPKDCYHQLVILQRIHVFLGQNEIGGIICLLRFGQPAPVAAKCPSGIGPRHTGHRPCFKHSAKSKGMAAPASQMGGWLPQMARQ
jgi:hypothetical protein